METVSLSVTARDQERSAKELRRSALVPCILYGNKTTNVSLQGDHNAIFKALVQAGESTVVELDIGKGKPQPVLFHAIDFDPVSERIVHVDFYAVDMNKEIDAPVPLHFVGESPAVKDHGGVFVAAMDHVTVYCLPAKLPHAIEVDISQLTALGDIVTAAELPVIDGVKYMVDGGLPVASVQAPRHEEEAPKPAAEADAAAPEGEKKESTTA
jgi:large subunit ribosomal protein L25